MRNCGADLAQQGYTFHRNLYEVKMTLEEAKKYLKSQKGIPEKQRSISIRPDDFDPNENADISSLLKANVALQTRKDAPVNCVQKILKKDSDTKIVIFTDGRICAGTIARQALQNAKLGCEYLSRDSSYQEQNKIIGFYQRKDLTPEDKRRPRALILHFEHAAGLNLQYACYNAIFFSPLYIGNGGTDSDPVSDCSTELQAIGRVCGEQQVSKDVYVWRIIVSGPNHEETFEFVASLIVSFEEASLASLTGSFNGPVQGSRQSRPNQVGRSIRWIFAWNPPPLAN